MGSRILYYTLIELVILIAVNALDGLKGIVLALSLSANSTENGVVFCYYDSASNARADYARFGVDDIPLDLCTHLIYSFIVPTADGNITFSEPQGTLEGKNNSFEDFVALKNTTDAANVKFMASLGGLKAGSENFTLVVNNIALRNKIIDNIYNFVRTNNLDGIDLLWQYPTLVGGASTDKVKYISFVQNLKTTFGGKYLLTAAVGPSQLQINQSYYVQDLNRHLDYISVMTYDYHDSSENVTSANAPLYAQETDGVDSTNNVNASIYTWIANGASPSKLVLGLGAFGKTFTLASLDNTSTGAPTTGDGAPGLTGVDGELSYLEICTEQNANPDSWSITDVDSNYAYANKDLFWVGYDNVDTAFAKGSYAKSLGLAGVMLWSLDLSDFSDTCGEKNLLLKAVDAGYKSASVTNPGNTSTISETNAMVQNKTYITVLTDDVLEDNNENGAQVDTDQVKVSFNHSKNTIKDEKASEMAAKPTNDRNGVHNKKPSKEANLLDNDQTPVNVKILSKLFTKSTSSYRNGNKYKKSSKKAAESTSISRRTEFINSWNLSAGARDKISVKIPNFSFKFSIGK